MAEAHRLASAELGRNPRDHPHSDRLARTVMRYFGQGVKDLTYLARLAVNSERRNAAVAAERDGLDAHAAFSQQGEPDGHSSAE